MSQDIPKMNKQWVVTGTKGLDSLEFTEGPVPEVGDSQVLYRDISILEGQYPFLIAPNVVIGSDGAGTVLAVGKHVRRFKPGDQVITFFDQAHFDGPLDLASTNTGLGGGVDGTLRTVGAFDEKGLVTLPQGLSFLEGATLPCAALTAWNALNGLPCKVPGPGDWVLTQGTGGVSIFALQFAKAAGARVIATTSSSEKAKLLERLGADHIINYRETPDWGDKAKQLTGGRGIDQVIELAGGASMAQSLNSIKAGGVISIVGVRNGLPGSEDPGFVQSLLRLCITRGILVGSRLQMEDMCRAMEGSLEKLRPVIDPKVFKLEQAKEAFEYLISTQHQGKVCIEIS
ncbi:hypothetical protein LCI18_015129 [Fusarium solani-melongenae]|uniref:Uncharacterized protein n=1 Tax=Fusarium solani subsp. cucurbitae TaxID=2747967 RepID=A0ACD3ZSF6_FUSSC|nr:hypothetical protein LCI18_015129 [Fusarium solani-melongenae]